MPALLIALLLTCSPLLAQGSPEQWSLVEQLRIGSIDGPHALTRVHAILPSRDGRQVYIGQRQESLIRVFDARSGRVIRTIGREGAGPGEFRSLTGIGWKADTLFAVDMALQHVSLFTPSGEHLRTERVSSAPLPTTGSPAYLNAYLADGTVLGSPRVSVGAGVAGWITSIPWVQMTRDGKIIRMVAEEDARGDFIKIQIGEGPLLIGGRPLSKSTFLQVAPDGASIIVVHAPPGTGSVARFHATRVGVGGDTIYHRAYRYSPRPVPAQVIDSIHNQLAQGLARRAPFAKALAAVKEQLILPEIQPPVTKVVVGSDGSTWVRREEMGEKTVGWLVLDPQGHIRASLRLPAGLEVRAVDRGRVWGTIKDELDGSYAVLYRIVPGTGR
jgi:hypothetical protein